MKFQRSLIAASIFSALLLSGCGSDSNDAATPDAQKTTITVIDGYLEDAQVCVDRNKSGHCDADEIVGMTNADGQIAINDSDLDFPIIAQTIAGKTRDQDSAGLARNSYEMVAHAGSTFVTPFTTMATVSEMTMEELANELSMELEIISSDYVGTKANEDNTISEEAKKAHLMARSLTSELAPKVSDNDASQLSKSANTISAEINKSINEDKNLDTITIEIDDDGNAESVEIISSLESYLEDEKPLYFASLNNTYVQQEGISTIEFNNGNYTVSNDKGGPDTGSYRVNNDDLIHVDEDGEFTEAFIYVSHSTSLAVTSDDDLNFWTKVDITSDATIPPVFTQTMLENQVWYFLDDDSDDKEVVRMMAKMDFSADQVIITEGGNTETLPYNITQDGNLYIDFPDGDRDLNVEIVTNDKHMLTVAESYLGKPTYSLMIKDEQLANSIWSKWGSK